MENTTLSAPTARVAEALRSWTFRDWARRHLFEDLRVAIDDDLVSVAQPCEEGAADENR